MEKSKSANLISVTVTGCQAAAAPDGVAIVIYTAESGPIAFGVNPQMIQAWRAALTKAEEYLSQAPGRA